MKTYGTTRNFRNHNPGNVRPVDLPDVWLGQVGIDNAPGGPFSIFGDYQNREADFWGIRACAHNFISYQVKDGCKTISEIISRHAPNTDNNDTHAYILFVASRLGVDPGVQINLSMDRVLLMQLCRAVFKDEGGNDPYPDQMVQDAVDAA